METNHDLAATVERLAAVAGALEQALGRLSERQQEVEASVGRISATVESTLEERLAGAEARIAELVTAVSVNAAETVTNGRRTLPAGMTALLAKQGVELDSLEAGTLDAALTSLSVEQRIAVKAQLMRAGMLG